MAQKPVKQPEGLILVLLDRDAGCGERDDAAMDLAAFDEPEAEAALIEVAANPTEHLSLADSCGESLGEIWVRKGRVDLKVLNNLHPAARAVVKARIEEAKPELLFGELTS